MNASLCSYFLDDGHQKMTSKSKSNPFPGKGHTSINRLLQLEGTLAHFNNHLWLLEGTIIWNNHIPIK